MADASTNGEATRTSSKALVEDTEVDVRDPKMTAHYIFYEFVTKIHATFTEAANSFRALDEEEAALQQYLQNELAKQEEKGKQLRGQIEKAQQSIQLFMRSLPGAVIEE
jgi:outer membrane lipopolysaccharide assembly protein LptE/RlpB